MNHASVLGLGTIGGGHVAASKLFSFLVLTPINKKIKREAKTLLEVELDCAAFAVKQFKFSNGEIEVDCSFKETVVDVGVTIDASWCSRGWSATDAVVAAISVDTVEVVDVVHLSSSCAKCKKWRRRRQKEQ